MILIFVILILVSCDQNSNQGSIIQEGIGHPSNYFPLEIGATWVYEITIGEGKALNYREVAWPDNNGGAVMVAVRSFFIGQLNDRAQTTFKLSYSIAEKPSTQGMYKYENARKIEVLIDELGVYEGHKELFWLISPGREFEINAVVTYDPNTPGAPANAWGGWNQADGSANYFIFFGAEPGTSISYSGSPESLALIAMENGILHFRHVVNSTNEGNINELSKYFQEDMWYEKGKGLIRLVQRVDGKITMTWELKKFYISINPINFI